MYASQLRVLLAALAVVFMTALGCATGASDDPARVEVVRTEPVSRATTPFEGFEWPTDERVRSAGRLRALEIDQEGGKDPAAAKAELREHFAAVLEWLDVHEEASLSVAVERLVSSAARPLEPIERGALYEVLRAARGEQIRRLEHYAAAGSFPINPDLSGRTRPLFVDATDTACAVGHLMRLGGFEEAVAEILRNNNGVYVPDIRSGPVLAWVATSGLTVEEAAVIQPGYAPPSNPGHELDTLAGGGSVVASGLVIDEFSASHTSLSLPSGINPGLLELLFPGVDPLTALGLLGQTPDASVTPYDVGDYTDITLHSGLYYISENGGSLEPIYETSPISSPWLFWNAQAAGGFFADSGTSNTLSWYEMSYEVSVATAGYGIDAATFMVPGGFWGGLNFGADLHFEVLIETVGVTPLVAFENTGGDYADFFGQSVIIQQDEFAAQEKVRVTVRGGQDLATQATQWSQLRQDFRVVPIPEPRVAILLGFGLLLLGRRPRE